MASLIICEGSTPAPACKACSTLIYVPPGRRGRKPHYCSEDCRPKPDAARAAPVPLSDIDCAACGTCFRPISSKQRNCSIECARAQSHLTRSANAAARNHRICKRCGAGFQKVRGSLGLYCSRACSDAVRKVYESRPEAKRARRQRWKERTGWKPAERAPVEKPAPKPARHCRECRTIFTPAYGDKRRTFCSDTCSSKASRRAAGKNHRKRARHHGVAYEPVNRIKLFERDRWRCQVCGVKTPKRLMGTTAPNAPEMDHRIPMAMGAPHSWANCQCACRRCNGLKGGTIIVGQLPLFAVPA